MLLIFAVVVLRDEDVMLSLQDIVEWLLLQHLWALRSTQGQQSHIRFNFDYALTN